MKSLILVVVCRSYGPKSAEFGSHLLDLDVVGKGFQNLEEFIKCYGIAVVDICLVKQCVGHQFHILQIWREILNSYDV